jgi:hypothetical protein
MLARFFLRRALPLIGIVAVCFAAFVWHSTARMQRGADEFLALVRSVQPRDEAMQAALHLRKSYYREVTEEPCSIGGRVCRTFRVRFENTWLRRLRLSATKGVIGTIDVDDRGYLIRSWIAGGQSISRSAGIEFSIRQEESIAPWPDSIFVHNFKGNHVSITLTPQTDSERREVALSVDVSFLSTREVGTTPQSMFRKDLGILYKGNR